MRELLDEVQSIVNRYSLLVEHQKKYHDYPYTSEYDHLYRWLISQCTLETWKKCEALLERFNTKRSGPVVILRSSEFEKRIDMELKRFLGYLTPKTRAEIIEYMKRLEWRVEHLEKGVTVTGD